MSDCGPHYDLDVMDMWERMERIISKVSGDNDVLPMTHLELVRYLRAMKLAEITDRAIVNGSGEILWFAVDGQTILIYPEERKEY